jgi:hypothetical protein
LDRLYVGFALLFHISLVAHFILRKLYFESYAFRYGWIVYALGIPAAVISVMLIRGEKGLSFWLGGFLFLAFAAYGYWIDYVAKIQFRNPLRMSVVIPYALLYLSTVMFYWWPVGQLSRPLWFVFGALFVIGSYFNITSH